MARSNELFKNIPPAGRPKPKAKVEDLGVKASAPKVAPAAKAVNTAGGQAQVTAPTILVARDSRLEI